MIRLASYSDLENAYKVISDTKEDFKEKGSSQWQDEDGYPSIITLENDIQRNELYVYEENSQIIAVFVLSSQEEEAYKYIYDGTWITNDKYMTLHRIAILREKRHQGIASKIMDYIFVIAKNKGYKSIKADTMENNIEMNRVFLKNGFVLCGKINLLREGVLDKMRLAYEKNL